VDVIQLDVTVLDQNRRPIRGLVAADFTVHENGKPQRVVAVSEITREMAGPAPSAWMLQVPADVGSNDLTDQIGDANVAAVMIDDSTLPFDSVKIAIATRDVAHYIIDQLTPPDRGAVIYPYNAGRSQDFTADLAKLDRAVDAFDPRPHQPDSRPMSAPSPPGRVTRSLLYDPMGTRMLPQDAGRPRPRRPGDAARQHSPASQDRVLSIDVRTVES